MNFFFSSFETNLRGTPKMPYLFPCRDPHSQPGRNSVQMKWGPFWCPLPDSFENYFASIMMDTLPKMMDGQHLKKDDMKFEK